MEGNKEEMKKPKPKKGIFGFTAVAQEQDPEIDLNEDQLKAAAHIATFFGAFGNFSMSVQRDYFYNK